MIVAVTQMSCSARADENIAKAENLVRLACEAGAEVILLQELFGSLYFCQEQSAENFCLAEEAHQSSLLQHFSEIARKRKVVLPISFFERSANVHFNSLACLLPDGSSAGIYRKAHIPDGPGYQEKFYFSPGNTGFRVFETKFGRIGAAICWDQWFPETARILALQGADVILYPTAIGTEPKIPGYDSSHHWQRVMQGHAAANMLPVCASNRIGQEMIGGSQITFYGKSFIADETGEIVRECDSVTESFTVYDFDVDNVRRRRQAWGLFRDRRTDLYGPILTLDGRQAN